MAQTSKKKNPKGLARTSEKPRLIKASRYKSFRLHKRIQHDKPKVTSAWKIWKASLRHLRKYVRPFGGIVLIYLVLTVIFVKGLGASTDIPLLKETVGGIFGGGAGQLIVGFTLFGELLSSAATTATPIASTYQSILLIIISLVLIWALRQTHAGQHVGVKESFYKSPHPLLPFLLVLTVIGLQLVPLIIGAGIFSTVITNGLAVTAIETVLWASLFFLLALLSLYMISSSIFALYIVTLPDMQPMQALRSARELVRYRRWTILRKILFLPLVLVIVATLLIVPTIIFIAPVAEWLFFVLSMAAIAVTHSYLYGLYRELL